MLKWPGAKNARLRTGHSLPRDVVCKKITISLFEAFVSLVR
jgi:hypothetical protein